MSEPGATPENHEGDAQHDVPPVDAGGADHSRGAEDTLHVERHAGSKSPAAGRLLPGGFLFRSIRGTLLAWQTVLLGAALAVFGVMVYQRERGIVIKDVDQKLAERSRALLPLVEAGGGAFVQNLPRGESRHYERRHGDGYHYAAWSADGALLDASLPGFPASLSALDSLGGPASPQAVSGKPKRREEFPPPPKSLGDVRQQWFDAPSGARLLIGKRLQPERERLAWLAGELLLGGGALLLLGLAGGWALSSLAVRPIEHLTQTAAGISASTLSQRLDESAAPLELRRLTGILNETFARLEQSFARQRQFTADASHELRTPLAVVLSQTELALARERTAGEYRQSLEACHRAAQRMKDTSASLLTLARADAEGLDLKRQWFDPAGVVRRAAEWHAEQARERNVRVDLELEEGLACLGDADLLTQAVGNLISNAVRYNVEGGRVAVRLLAAGGEAAVRVTDTGIGIPAEHQAHVFDRFYRVDPARSRQVGGSGLGLAISKEIVHAHGGRITLASRAGHGSTFEIRLPAAVASDDDLDVAADILRGPSTI